MAMNKKKTTTAIVAGVTAVALLLGGTFAWTSISQRALNEAAGIVNVGGRLHDDFNGENKDIYVENFTDPLNGGQPIYARIKLTEYMEVGQDAGGFGADVNNDGRVVAVPVIDGTDINDLDSWKVFIPGSITDKDITCADCSEEGNTDCTIHNHWKWEVGGKTTYMPTFNKDKDSLESDINGSYQGTNPGDKVYYDDYVIYTTDNTAEGVGIGIAEDQKEAHTGSIYSVVGTEYYDDDPTNDENIHSQNIGAFKTVSRVTHTAKETGTATVITMAEWLQNPVAGNFWVYDTDGWAYWANPIMPGESTGLLLDGIDMFKNPGEKCYYSINVVAEFATIGDWEYFTGINETDNANALEVLNAAAANVPTVTMNIVGDVMSSYYPGETVEFEASVTVNGKPVEDAGAITYSILDSTKYQSKIAGNTLTVGEESAANTVLTVVATSENYPGAVAMKSIYCSGPVLTFTYDGYSTFDYMIYTPGESVTLAYTLNDPRGDFAGVEPVYEATNATVEGNVVTISPDLKQGDTVVVTAKLTNAQGKSMTKEVMNYEYVFKSQAGRISTLPDSKRTGSLDFLENSNVYVNEETNTIVILATDDPDDAFDIRMNGPSSPVVVKGTLYDSEYFDRRESTVKLDVGIAGVHTYSSRCKDDTEGTWSWEFTIKVFGQAFSEVSE